MLKKKQWSMVTGRRVCFTLASALCAVSHVDSFINPMRWTKHDLAVLRGKAVVEVDKDRLAELSHSTSATVARNIINESVSESGRLFGSVSIPPGASTRGISDADLAIQTRLLNKQYRVTDLIDLSGNRDSERASFGILSVFVSTSIAAVIANQNLPGPEIVRFVVVWLLVFAPLFVVGYGIRDAESLQALLVQIQRQFFPTYRKRMLQHEAGHFLMAHLVGFPIKDYQANAVKNAVSFHPLADADRGQDFANRLGFDRPRRDAPEKTGNTYEERERSSRAKYFSDEGRGSTLIKEQSVLQRNATQPASLPPPNDPARTWPFRGFDATTLDELTVISVAGVCAEILAFGNAEGGIADFNQLKAIFQGSENEVSEKEADNRIRFALGYTMSQLRLHLAVLDRLADAMERDASIADCVVAIETCADLTGPPGYEKQRRRSFAVEGVVERTVLGDRSNLELFGDQQTDNNGLKINLTGDDPIYLAVGIAFAFFLWASSGGLSLH